MNMCNKISNRFDHFKTKYIIFKYSISYTVCFIKHVIFSLKTQNPNTRLPIYEYFSIHLEY